MLDSVEASSVAGVMLPGQRAPPQPIFAPTAEVLRWHHPCRLSYRSVAPWAAQAEQGSGDACALGPFLVVSRR